MPPTAIILIDHGSRQIDAREALDEVAELAAGRLGLPVGVAHLSIARPTLNEAIDRAVAAGSRRIIVCPYLLAVGTHTRRDIPDRVAAAASRHPNVTIQVAPPLGPDVLLAELVARRVQPLLRSAEGV